MIFLLFTVLSVIQVIAAKFNTSVPIVMWHGMGKWSYLKTFLKSSVEISLMSYVGDSCCNPFSLGSIKKLIEDNMPPGSYVMSIKIGSNMIEVWTILSY